MSSDILRKLINIVVEHQQSGEMSPNVLLEDRTEYIASSMKKRLEDAVQQDLGRPIDSLQVVNQLKQADPDPRGKNIQWLANMYAANQFKMEDLPRVKSEIEKFQTHRAQLPIKDLNQIRDLNSLYDMLDKLPADVAEPPQSQRAREREIKSDAVKVIDTPNFKVIIPKTEEASCLYGSGTRWCTAARDNNVFDQYNKQGNLYIIMANLGGRQRKFQLHVEGDQFMDERDQSVNKRDIAALSNMPEYTKFLNQLIEKHYGKYFKNAEAAT